jgi:hypothetical protein
MTSIVSNNNLKTYVTGRYLRIRRLENQYSPKYGGSEDDYVYLVNILLIKVYDRTGQSYRLDNATNTVVSNKYTSSSYLSGNSNAGYWSIDYALRQNASISGSVYYYHSNIGDNTATILIKFNNDIDISKIDIQKRPGFDRFSNIYVEILDSNRNIQFRKQIRPQDSTKDLIPNDTIFPININILDTYIDQCNRTICPKITPCPTLPQSDCYSPIDPNSYKSQIDNMNEKLNTLQTNITNLNTLIDDIKTQNRSDIENLLKLKAQYSNLLDILKTKLLNNDIIKNAEIITDLKISQDPITETFKNYNDTIKSDKESDKIKINDTINTNDVTSYDLDLERDKKIEQFANFIQPKLDIYEKFTNWEKDFIDNKTTLTYAPPTFIKNPLTVDSSVPIVKKNNYEKNLNMNVGKLLSNKIMDKSNKMIGYWDRKIQ